MAPAARKRLIACLALAGLLAGCGGDDPDRTLVDRLTAGSFQEPEEFAVLPQRPLELPPDLTVLPPPDPGGPSRVDLTPRSDALVALTGRSTTGGAVAGDQALLLATRANQRNPEIRQILSQEDAEWRSRPHGPVLDRLFGLTGDREIYSEELLDAEAELLRLRALGVWVPQMPPVE